MPSRIRSLEIPSAWRWSLAFRLCLPAGFSDVLLWALLLQTLLFPSPLWLGTALRAPSVLDMCSRNGSKTSFCTWSRQKLRQTLIRASWRVKSGKIPFAVTQARKARTSQAGHSLSFPCRNHPRTPSLTGVESENPMW